jgi:hypothetical protein
MTRLTKCLAVAVAIGGLDAPLAAQSAYGYQQQAYPQQTNPAYGQQTYPGYNQGYGQQGYGQNPVGQIIDQLLGNRYNVTDRQAVSQCASAAISQASARYGNGYNQQYGQRYGQQYGQRYNGSSAMRVTAVTEVQRRQSGLRVSGLLSSGGSYGGQYGHQYRYENGGSAGGDLTFRCNVDYRGQVTNVRINRNSDYRG